MLAVARPEHKRKLPLSPWKLSFAAPGTHKLSRVRPSLNR